MNISILVLCYECTQYTKNTIDSIHKTARSNYDLILCPNKASASINSNMLLDRATSEYIILMDDDLKFVADGWDCRLIDTLEKHWSMGIRVVAPRLFNETGGKLNQQSVIGKGTVVADVKSSGAVLAFRDAGIRFDENYIKTQYNDVDVMYQWMSAGYKIAIDGGVDVWHMKKATTCHTPWAKVNRKYFVKKWGMDDYKMWPGEQIIS